ncbi:MAG: hypothetical protein PHQ27_01395 [Victivallales bacterium]|nr:hypothetical protein [Victivallales bacterium]
MTVTAVTPRTESPPNCVRAAADAAGRRHVSFTSLLQEQTQEAGIAAADVAGETDDRANAAAERDRAPDRDPGAEDKKGFATTPYLSGETMVVSVSAGANSASSRLPAAASAFVAATRSETEASPKTAGTGTDVCSRLTAPLLTGSTGNSGAVALAAMPRRRVAPDPTGAADRCPKVKTSESSATARETTSPTAGSGRRLAARDGVTIHRISSGGSSAGTAVAAGGSEHRLLAAVTENYSRHRQWRSAEAAAATPATTEKISSTGAAAGGSRHRVLPVVAGNMIDGMSGLNGSGRTVMRHVTGADSAPGEAMATTTTVAAERLALVRQLTESITTALPQRTEASDGNADRSVTVDFATEALGRLRFSVRHQGEALRVVFEPGSESCRRQLQEQRADLTRQLTQLGYRECTLDITGGDHNTSGKRREAEDNSPPGNADADNVRLAGDDRDDLARLAAATGTGTGGMVG